MKMQAIKNLAILLLVIVLVKWAYPQSYTAAHTYGDKNLLQDFLCSEIVYPPDALNKGIQGKVVLSFFVGTNGKVSQIKVEHTVNPELDSEAVRLFKMLLWEPAISLGQPVASKIEFPVDFNIKKYNKHCKARGYDTIAYPYQPVDSSYTVYEYAETDKRPYPVFDEQGMTLSKFISKNIKYPETAYRQSISGKVTLRFVVEPNGRASNIKVLSPVGGGCTQEAIRILQMIHWMPGIKEDRAVRTFMELDIEFKLPEKSDVNMFENGQMQSN